MPPPPKREQGNLNVTTSVLFFRERISFFFFVCFTAFMREYQLKKLMEARRNLHSRTQHNEVRQHSIEFSLRYMHRLQYCYVITNQLNDGGYRKRSCITDNGLVCHYIHEKPFAGVNGSGKAQQAGQTQTDRWYQPS